MTKMFDNSFLAVPVLKLKQCLMVENESKRSLHDKITIYEVNFISLFFFFQNPASRIKLKIGLQAPNPRFQFS